MKIFGRRACWRALRTLHGVRGSHGVTDESAQRNGARWRGFLEVATDKAAGGESLTHFSDNDIMCIIGNR